MLIHLFNILTGRTPLYFGTIPTDEFDRLSDEMQQAVDEVLTTGGRNER